MIRTPVPGGALKRMLGATVLALASAGAAQAAVITFEGNSGPAFNQDTIMESGYAVTFVAPDIAPGVPVPPGAVQVGRFINGASPASCGANICPSNNATTYFDLFGNGYVDLMPGTGTGTFSFRGLDASFIGTPGTTYPPTAGAIQVIGFYADGSTASAQFNLAGPTDGTTTFGRFKASAEFAQLQFSEVAIVGFLCNAKGQCTALDNNAGQFALDNITLSDLPAGNVPEPATASLLALGLLGLARRARRRA
jgi:hypothetical protein